MELARCEWIEQKYNCCLVGSHGTGKTHVAVGLGLAAHCAGLRVRFFTAAELVSQLEKEQKQYTLDRFLGELERADLLICDELGYVTLSRGGVESPVSGVRRPVCRPDMLVTNNLLFSEWNQIFQGERMTAALLDRLTHHCHIFEMNGESYRFRESMKSKRSRKIGVKTKLPVWSERPFSKRGWVKFCALRVGQSWPGSVPRGITVNVVSPGATDTELFGQGKTEQDKQRFAQLAALGRLGQPEDIADVVALLVSDDANWITGQNIRANGGTI